ncbi:dTDP-4-dehydrorhamnose 3,5-epimerase [Flavobacteriaceae bacterium F08102]|nr:dTDP-4-dehydrorhamnose 3,5-epimerase [Flavobacteriaceae bacterium F08102]
MTIETTNIEGILIINPTVYSDSRGYFLESYNKERLKDVLNVSFVQDNESLSQKGVLRGLHFQNPPYAQGKLVRVIKGSVLDVAVDIRKASPTYGQAYHKILSEENKTSLYIPEGFAHGFLVLEDNTIFSYKCTKYYHKPSEDAILWNDETLGIQWNIKNPILSEKDKNAQKFATFVSNF